MGKLIDVNEAAARLEITGRRLRALCADRRVPGARFLGGRWYVPEDTKITPATKGPKLGSK